jgi:hypothetical protein
MSYIVLLGRLQVLQEIYKSVSEEFQQIKILVMAIK